MRTSSVILQGPLSRVAQTLVSAAPRLIGALSGRDESRPCGQECPRHKARLSFVLFALVATAACRQDMHDQPKYIPLRPSNFFGDGRSQRPLIEGTVARGHLDDDTAMYTGKGPDGKFLDTFPVPVTKEVIQRGQQRFNIYCTPCHDRNGTGNGMVVQRGFRHPPSYHIDRLRMVPNGYIFDVITNGFGAMPDYANQIQPADRWAVVSYVRALQLSQQGTVNDVPPEARAQLAASGQPGGVR